MKWKWKFKFHNLKICLIIWINSNNNVKIAAAVFLTGSLHMDWNRCLVLFNPVLSIIAIALNVLVTYYIINTKKKFDDAKCSDQSGASDPLKAACSDVLLGYQVWLAGALLIGIYSLVSFILAYLARLSTTYGRVKYDDSCC